MASSELNPNAAPFVLRSPLRYYYHAPPFPPPTTSSFGPQTDCYLNPNCFPLLIPFSSVYTPNIVFSYRQRWSQFDEAVMINKQGDYDISTSGVAAQPDELPEEEIKQPIIIEEVKEEDAEINSRETRPSPAGSNRASSRNSRRRGFMKKRWWKKKDGALEFKEEEAALKFDQEGGRTTVMLKNIPNKFDKKKLLGLLDDHCRKANEKLQSSAAFSEFDFLYLPIDFKTGCNYGYAFVNFTTPAAASRLHGEMHRMSWATHGSSKICEVTYARIQGLSALLDHFKKSVFVCEDGEYRPVHFIPTRNGLRPVSQQLIGSHVVPPKKEGRA